MKLAEIKHFALPCAILNMTCRTLLARLNYFDDADDDDDDDVRLCHIKPGYTNE